MLPHFQLTYSFSRYLCRFVVLTLIIVCVSQTRADFVSEHNTAVNDDGQLTEELVRFFSFKI